MYQHEKLFQFIWRQKLLNIYFILLLQAFQPLKYHNKQVGAELGQAQPSWSYAGCWSKSAIIGLRIDPKAFIGPTQIGKQLCFWLLCCLMPSLNLSGWVAGWVGG